MNMAARQITQKSDGPRKATSAGLTKYRYPLWIFKPGRQLYRNILHFDMG